MQIRALTRTMSLGALLCATLTGCTGPSLREELRIKDVQLESLQAQLRTAQEQNRSTQAQLTQTSDRLRYQQGLMKGLATQLRRVLRQVDSGFTPQPGDLGGPSDAPGPSSDQPVLPDPVSSPPVTRVP